MVSDVTGYENLRAAFTGRDEPLDFRVLELAGVPTGGLVVEVTHAGICGSDVHRLDGDVPNAGHPVAFGHEGVGVVRSLAPGVAADSAGDALAVGDRVYWTPYERCGRCRACVVHDDAFPCEVLSWPPAADKPSAATFQRFAALTPSHEVYRISEGTPSEAVIAFGCAMIAALGGFDRLGKIDAGQTVVVQGSGPVGLAATMLASLSHARQVIVIGDPANRLAAARRMGATTVLSLGDTSAKDRAQMIGDLTGGRGADVVIEAAGHLSAFDEGLNLLGFNGRYLVVGLWSGQGTVPVDPFRLTNLSIRIIGSLGVRVGTHRRALQLIEAHHERLDLASLVTHSFPLRDLESAIDATRRGEAIKSVVTPSAFA